MEKLLEIDEFLKFLPKLSNEEEKSQNKSHKTKTKQKIQNGASTINQINQNLKEKMKSFNTNSQKNSNTKKQRKSFKQPKNVKKSEKSEKILN
jgi:hypothetical protein